MKSKIKKLFQSIFVKFQDILENKRILKKQNSVYKFLIKSGVETEFGFVTLIGKPIIQKYPNSRIIIKKGVTLVSDMNENPAGISHPVILATLREGAELILHKDCGLSGATICAATKIEIGEYGSIGVNVSIYDTDFHSVNPYERKFDNLNKTISKPISIGNFVWIGGHSIILKGVIIGNGAVVGAGSVVTKNIPELNIFAGNPAKFIKKIEINNETYNYLFNTCPK